MLANGRYSIFIIILYFNNSKEHWEIHCVLVLTLQVVYLAHMAILHSITCLQSIYMYNGFFRDQKHSQLQVECVYISYCSVVNDCLLYILVSIIMPGSHYCRSFTEHDLSVIFSSTSSLEDISQIIAWSQFFFSLIYIVYVSNNTVY